MQTRRGIILYSLLILLLGTETWQNPISQLNQNQATTSCGLSPRISQRTQGRRGKRIVGGQLTQYGRWPWVVTLIVNNSHYCSGSIVRKKWIVTTSHCFHSNYTSLNAKDWLVKVGKFNLKKKEQYEQTSTVKQIIRHPNYTSLWDLQQIDRPDDNDVALLELDTPIRYTTHASPICLQDDNTRIFLPGDTCVIAGWGHTKFGGNVQDELNDVSIKLVPHAICNSPQSYNGSIHARAICAGYKEGGRDACQYDSGGPLFCDDAGRWYLVGQVSWGDKCALPHKYGVYSNMKVLSPWVLQTIAKN